MPTKSAILFLSIFKTKTQLLSKHQHTRECPEGPRLERDYLPRGHVLAGPSGGRISESDASA